jgi:peptidoglycan biosynthesis protein MviN/MurJ (putative lipid II flippase)
MAKRTDTLEDVFIVIIGAMAIGLSLFVHVNDKIFPVALSIALSVIAVMFIIINDYKENDDENKGPKELLQMPIFVILFGIGSCSIVAYSLNNMDMNNWIEHSVMIPVIAVVGLIISHMLSLFITYEQLS